MNNWKKVKLGSILTESKIEAVESNADSRIRVLLNTNGVIKRPLTKETKGATKYYKRSEGQFIYGKQNLHKGAFGIIPKELDGFTSSSDLPAFDVDKSCLPEWLDYFLKQGDFYLSLIDIAKGAATKRIQPKALFEVEIPLPDTTQEQQEIIEGFKNKERYNELLNSEIQTQKQLVSQLKQAILQEAIQGKLTSDWRASHPELVKGSHAAEALLKHIKAEKEQLIKDKKIRKEKPLPPITEAEIPFEIPESWSWCRFKDIVHYRKGKKPSPLLKEKSEKYNIPYIDIEAFEKNIIKRYTNDPKAVIGNDKNILLVWDGSRMGLIGRGKAGAVGSTLVKISLIDNNYDFIYFLLKSKFKLFNNNPKQAGLPHMNGPMLDSMLVALPPLEEQKAIVEKVETLLQKCKALEQEITQSEQHANMLMQAVLKEAFERKT